MRHPFLLALIWAPRPHGLHQRLPGFQLGWASGGTADWGVVEREAAHLSPGTALASAAVGGMAPNQGCLSQLQLSLDPLFRPRVVTAPAVVDPGCHTMSCGSPNPAYTSVNGLFTKPSSVKPSEVGHLISARACPGQAPHGYQSGGVWAKGTLIGWSPC